MNEKSAVLVFSTAYFPFVGGAEVAIQEAAKRLGDKYDFFVFTSRMDGKLPAREKRSEGLVVRIGFGNKLDKFLLPILGVWAAYKLKKNKKNIILWGMDLSFGALAAALFKFLNPKIPFVFTIQYGYGDERVASGRLGVIGLAFRLILTQADYVTAISTYLLNLCKQYGYIGEEAVIHNGVELEKFRANESFRFPRQARGGVQSHTKPAQRLIGSQNRHTVITVSRLVPKNGVDILIRAISELKKEMTDIKCHILGDGDERKNLESMAYNLGLTTNIKFFGAVPYENISKYLAEADVFARPSRSEGMGNSFVEALAAGLPIVGTPVGGILDIIEDRKTGLFSKVDDPKDLAEKIKILLKDKALAAQIVKNGQKIVKGRFSWDKIAESYNNVFMHGLEVKKQILIATGLFPPESGGPATYSKILLDELPKENFGVRVLNFGSVRYLPRGVRHIAYFLRALRLGRNADIIFAQDPVSVGFPAMLTVKILRKKFILKIVGDYAWEQGVQRFGVKEVLDDFLNRKYGFRVEFLRKIEKFVANRADKIIVPSEYLKKVVTKWGISPDKIFVVYNAFEQRRDNESLRFSRSPGRLARGGFAKPAQQLIVSAGRLVPWKGFSVLIEIMPELLRDFPNLKLVIIGDGPECEALKLKTINYQLQTNVIFTGNMPREKVLEYLATANVFVLNTAYEGFSHLILEAMAMGAPVITTNVCGNPELVEDGVSGILVGFNDRDALKNSILKLLKDEKLAQKLSSAAFQKSKEFSKERMISETVKILV